MKKNLFVIGTVICFAAAAAPGAQCTNSAYDVDGTTVVGTYTVRHVADSLAFDQLPAQVKATIRSQAPSEQIRKITLQTKDGQTQYRVEFERRSNWKPHPELVVSSDGSVLKEKHMANTVNEPAGASNK